MLFLVSGAVFKIHFILNFSGTIDPTDSGFKESLKEQVNHVCKCQKVILYSLIYIIYDISLFFVQRLMIHYLLFLILFLCKSVYLDKLLRFL